LPEALVVFERDVEDVEEEVERGDEFVFFEGDEDGPTTDTNSPLFTEKFTFLSDTTLPIAETYTLDRFSTVRAASELSP